jgi:hypothetical protein
MMKHNSATPGIRLTPNAGGSDTADALICPRCDFEYLHHGAVTVYDRSEDERETLVTTCNARQTTMESKPSRGVLNPSIRRHGLTIAFRRENCGDGLTLTVEQHKGLTYLHWRIEPPSTDWKTAECREWPEAGLEADPLLATEENNHD